MTPRLPFSGFYQLGFVGRDLDRATAHLARRYGIERFRRKVHSPGFETAHAYAGEVMVEVICCEPGSRELYDGYHPDEAEAVRLHHHGFRIADEAQWLETNAAAEASGFRIFSSSAFDGQLKLIYVDTRRDLGIFSEFVWFTGEALRY